MCFGLIRLGGGQYTKPPICKKNLHSMKWIQECPTKDVLVSGSEIVAKGVGQKGD